MRWMVRARGQRGSYGGFLIPLAATFGLLMLLVALSIVFFIPKVMLSRSGKRKQQERLAEYQKRRAFFEASGWGWECV